MISLNFSIKFLLSFSINKSINPLIKLLKSDPKFIIINSSHSFNKHFYISIILKELGFNIITVENLINATKSVTTNTVLIINNIFILSNQDKLFLKAIIKSKLPCFIILFHNLEHNKYLINIEKYRKEIKFNSFSAEDMSKFAYFLTKQFKITYLSNVLGNLIDLSSNDIHKFLLIVNKINKSVITMSDINTYNTIYKENYQSSNIYTATNNLLNSKQTILNTITISNEHKMLLPLMVHKNYINVLSKKKVLTPKNILTISNKLLTSDVIEYYIFNDYNWYLQSTFDFFSSSYISLYINKLSNINPFIKMEYCKESTHYSTKILIKKYYNHLINSYFSNLSYIDLIYLNHFCYTLLINNKNIIKEFISFHKLTLKDFEIILKLNKIQNYNTKNIKKLLS